VHFLLATAWMCPCKVDFTGLSWSSFSQLPITIPTMTHMGGYQWDSKKLVIGLNCRTLTTQPQLFLKLIKQY